MEHPFFPMTTTRAEALRWLTIAEKLLSARDLMGSKSFATRARDADPTLSPADQILAVADTLLAGDMRIGNNLQDLYAILRLTPQQGRDAELIDRQYRSLALILNPQKNNFPFSEQAFALVLDAWSVLSNPSRKLMYDKELAFYLQPQPQHQPQPTPPLPQQPTDMFGNPIPVMHHNIFAGVSSSSGVTYQSQPQGVTYPPQPQSQPQPQPHSTLHFSQVHVHSNSPVEPVVGESVRIQPNLMNFSSAPAPNIVFGQGLGSKPGVESLNKQPQETTYSHYQGNVAGAAATTAPGTGQAQMSNNQEQPHYSNVGDGSSHTHTHTHNVNVNENLQEEDPPVVEEEEEDDERMEAEDEEEVDAPTDDIDDDPSPFWTACPYCYYMYEYPRIYVDCTLRCSNCKMAFQAVVIPSPPPIVDGQEGYFCCWGFIPMGFSMEHWEKNKAASSTWTPFSPMFNLPQGLGNNPKRQPGSRKTEPRIYVDVDDDEVFVEFSDSSESDDADWRNTQRKRKKKRVPNPRGRGASGTPNRTSKRGLTDKGKNVEPLDGSVPPEGVEATTPIKTAGGEMGNKANAVVTARKQPARAAKNFGKLDLNVECSNEAEEAAPRVNEANGPGHGQGHGHGGDDNIEGIGFFEGLDEFLSSLPILNVVGEEKVVKAA